MSFELRPYQATDFGRLRASYAGGAHRAPLYVLPTGGGKTVTFAHIVRGATQLGRTTLIVAHRRELIRQAGEKLTLAGVDHSFIAAGFPHDPTAQVFVASIQTLIAGGRVARLPKFGLIVLDEAHHSRSQSYASLLSHQLDAKLLGVTATPARLDGKGLGVRAGGWFDDIVIGPTTADLVRQGYLSRVRCFWPDGTPSFKGVRTLAGDYDMAQAADRMDTATITGDIIAHYAQRADHMPGLVFCCTVRHAANVAQAFQDAGYRAAMVCGATPKAERDAAIHGLAHGDPEVLTSCDLIGEGLDVPAVRCVSLARPTKSLVLCRQQIGRGMRIERDKPHLIVNDHVGNLDLHGPPDFEPVWSLHDGVAPKKKGQGVPGVWRCKACSCLNSMTETICEECGAERETFGRATPEQVAGELREITSERIAEIKAMGNREATHVLTLTELRIFAKFKGYKRGWAMHVMRARAANVSTEPRPLRGIVSRSTNGAFNF